MHQEKERIAQGDVLGPHRAVNVLVDVIVFDDPLHESSELLTLVLSISGGNNVLVWSDALSRSC
ncbi:MAG TPA: hypothetical protein VKB77_14395 [Terriglobales bacterium]|nr:hypothetical protein [Terriglobales bacterium]